MKKYFIFYIFIYIYIYKYIYIYIIFVFNILKRYLKHRFTLKSCNIQVIFQVHLAQVFWIIAKIYKKKISTLESLYEAPLDT